MKLSTWLKSRRRRQPETPRQAPPQQSARLEEAPQNLYKGTKREEAPEELLYKNLKMKPADPNKAKLYALALCCAAAFIALLTFRSNFDYFLQYYTGWSLRTRVAVFLGVETFLILAPATKGYGNRRQIKWAFILELVIIPLLFLHTYLVGESIETRKEAEATKVTAQADLNRERYDATAAAKSNKEALDSFNKAQQSYNAAMARYERLKRQALRDETPMPPMPTQPVQPQLIPVAKINDELVTSATMAVDAVVQRKVDHNTLRALQFLILLCAIAGTTCIVLFSDAMRIREWFMRKREDDLNETMQSSEPYHMIKPPQVTTLPTDQGGQVQVVAQKQAPGFVSPISPTVQAPPPTYAANPSQARPGDSQGKT
jgi:hypothetical protein